MLVRTRETTAARGARADRNEGSKRRFDIHTVLRRIRAAVAEHADAAMFDLAERGFKSVFQQLVACIISIRTRDEVSLPVAIELLERAPTPEKMAKLSVAQIDTLIRSAPQATPIVRFAHLGPTPRNDVRTSKSHGSSPPNSSTVRLAISRIWAAFAS